MFTFYVDKLFKIQILKRKRELALIDNKSDVKVDIKIEITILLLFYIRIITLADMFPLYFV